MKLKTKVIASLMICSIYYKSNLFFKTSIKIISFFFFYIRNSILLSDLD